MRVPRQCDVWKRLLKITSPPSLFSHPNRCQDVTITNDGATILKLLEVEHPAARVLVELADLQDQEIGDGTTSVVIIAAELLRLAEGLVRDKIHPTSIISGCVTQSPTARLRPVWYIHELPAFNSSYLGLSHHIVALTCGHTRHEVTFRHVRAHTHTHT